MMESYNRQPLAPLFFVIYLCIVLYIINNVLLAMVYSAFQDNQKEKFKKLYLHRRYVQKFNKSIIYAYIKTHDSES